MAFLRFTRDKRGYESTFLLQNSRHGSKFRSRVLYWFRTPANVKVGRAVLDEEAVRLIEEANPDIDIEWDKVLKAKMPARPPTSDDRAGRSRRRGQGGSTGAARTPADGSAKRTRGSRSAPSPSSSSSTGESSSALPAPAKRQRSGRQRNAPPPVAPDPGALGAESVASAAEQEDRAAGPLPDPQDDLLRPDGPDGPDVADGADGDDAADDLSEVGTSREHPVEQLVGKEGHARLQVRFAELLARISERVTDPARRDQLRAAAESLDPDGWVTVAEATAAIETLDARYAEFRNTLGRRRRGGGGTSVPVDAGPTEAAPVADAAEAPSASDADEPDGNR